MKRTQILVVFLAFVMPVFGQTDQELLKEVESYQLKIDSINSEIERLETKIDSYSHLRDLASEKLKLRTIEGVNGGKGIVTNATVKTDLGEFNLYETPNGKIIKKFPINSKITVFALIGKYYKTEYNGTTGYVNADYLHLSSNYQKIFKDIEEVNRIDSEIVNQGSEVNLGNNYYNSRNSSSSSSSSKSKATLKYNGPVHVRGYYRTTKSGKKVYVRPHTRSRSK